MGRTIYRKFTQVAQIPVVSCKNLSEIHTTRSDSGGVVQKKIGNSHKSL